MDPLADLLVGVRARSTAFCQAILEPPWALRIADGAALALATTLRGDAWIVPDQGEPALMHSGDVAIIKGPSPYTVADDPATRPGHHRPRRQPADHQRRSRCHRCSPARAAHQRIHP